MTTPEERAEWQALAEAATEGPWYWRNTQDVYLFGARSRVVMAFERMGMQRAQPAFRGKDNLLYPAGRENINGFTDAAFIAAAREAVPALLDDLETVEAERDSLRARIEALADEWARLPVWGPDERGLMILDGIDRDELLTELRALLAGDSA